MIKLGKYAQCKGNKYELIGLAVHSETGEEMVVYRDLHGDGGMWVRPAAIWNEFVERDGDQIKRFAHEDELAPELDAIASKPMVVAECPVVGVYNKSAPEEKVALFLSMFTGREDVFAKRWGDDKRSGYSPACKNEWKPNCDKRGSKVKCSECPNPDFYRFDADAIVKHLKGEMTIGAYAMLTDETCRFLAFDFDGKEYSQEALRRDVTVIREVCAEKQISVAVERSRSGKGIHFWLFLSENIPASTARKLGSSIITYATNKCHELTFKTYDRLIPAQDTMPKGGFGSLIALPLQKKPRKQGNSVFVDENFTVYEDQWNYLSSIRKYSLDEVELFIRDLSPAGDLGLLRKDEEDDKPWKSPKPLPKISQSDFPEKVSIVRANMLYIEKQGISSSALNSLKRLAAFRNPKFYELQAMRKSTFDKKTRMNIPRIISCSDETEQYLGLPRGLEDEVKQIIESCSVRVDWVDEMNVGRGIDVTFNGKLREQQQPAVDELLAHDNGILAATTAFGKTVIGVYLIAKRKVNTLVLVEKTSLLSQWLNRLNEFLAVNEEPIVKLTPKGRKRKKSAIGQIGGGKNNLSGIIDIATMQSLVSGGEVKELVRNYGMIIIDECHHGAAFSYEKVLKYANAKYVYGLTATPTRKDGHHPIIYMQCGKIRYRVDAKSEAEERPFEHYVIPRFTRFRKPAHRGETWEYTDILDDIQKNELRNDLIVQDVAAAVEQGRNPIILTERKEHVKYFTDKLSSITSNVIPLTGGGGQKKSRESLKAVMDIPADEPFVLVATGKYIGEGFDMPRLDTLFLTMPISWKGTVAQYAGRLHRLFDGKTEVHVYDYVDIHEPTLEGMYQKRLKSYTAIGYTAKATPQQMEGIHSIFDNRNFFPVYSTDIAAAQNEVLIVSPFLSMRRVQSALSYLTAEKVHKTVVTRPLENYAEKDRTRISGLIDTLIQHGINVKTKDSIHQKFAVIDQRIIWYGSINLLSYGVSEESIMRIESPDIAAELAGIV